MLKSGISLFILCTIKSKVLVQEPGFDSNTPLLLECFFLYIAQVFLSDKTTMPKKVKGLDNNVTTSQFTGYQIALQPGSITLSAVLSHEIVRSSWHRD